MATFYLLTGILLLAILIYARLRWWNPIIIIPQQPDSNGNGIQWKVHFQLLFRALRSGYVVQQVHIRELVTDCHNPEFVDPDIKYNNVFWEAWEVPAGQRITQRRIDNNDFDDAFSYRVPINDLPFGRGRARLEVRAIVRFYPGATLPATFISHNPATRAGEALSDATRPPFWGPGNSGARHELTYEWNNCGDQPPFSYTEVPKFGS